MQIKCTKTMGYQFGRYDVRRGFTSKVTFKGLTLGKIYRVYGMIIAAEELRYLIYDDFCMPMWYPAELFQAETTQLPASWHHRYLGQDGAGLSAIWGYDELVNSPEHYNGLTQQEPDHVVLFLRHNRVVEEECPR